MKRFIFIVCVLCSFALSFKAQQLIQFSQFHNNQGVLNPAAVGVNDYLAVNLGMRYQWMGFNNDVQGNVAPRSIFLKGE